MTKVSSIFKKTLRLLVYYFAFIGFLPVLLLLIGILSNSGDNEKIKTQQDLEPSILTLKLDGPIRESSESNIESLIKNMLRGEEASIYVPDMVHVLQEAGENPNIKALLLEVGSISGTYASANELRNVLGDFKQTGKPIFAYLKNGSDLSYYIASAAGDITMLPASQVQTIGPVFQLTYFKEALNKLGISFDLPRAGKFKSGIEPFSRQSPSPEVLENYQTMEAATRNSIIAQIAADRKKTVEVVSSWYRQGFFINKDAIQQGLIDRLGYRKLSEEMLEQELKNIPVKYLPYENFSSILKQEGLSGKGVGIIELVGEINDHSKDSDNINVEAAVKKLDWALGENDVESVLIRVSSPGGSITAAEQIWAKVEELSRKKPVIISMGSYAASGGYYISAPAVRVFANPTTITGSIGVYSMIPNGRLLEDKWGVSFHLIGDSDRRDLLDFGKPASSRDLTLLENMIHEAYELFLSRVSKGRKMAIAAVDKVGQGRVYTGEEASQIGLVDQIGGYKEALIKAGEYIGIKKGLPRAIYQHKSYDFNSCLKDFANCLSTISDQTNLRALTHSIYQSMGTDTPETKLLGSNKASKHLQAVLSKKNGQVYAYWPGYFAL